MMVQEFEPRIVGFLCNWCSYAGADLAGVSRFQYPTNIRVIRVMCSGWIDPVLIFRAFIEGVDGILIGGCHPGDCHYLDGNYHAERKIKMTKTLLEKTGLKPERLHLEWISASEGEQFAHMVTDFVKRIKDLGPTPVLDDSKENLKMRLLAAHDAVEDQRLRALVGHEYKVTVEGNVYGEKILMERWEKVLEEAMESELSRHLILRLLNEKEHTVKSLAASLKIPSRMVLKYIISLRQDNLIAESGHEGMSLKYVAIKVGGD